MNEPERPRGLSLSLEIAEVEKADDEDQLGAALELNFGGKKRRIYLTAEQLEAFRRKYPSDEDGE